MVKLISILILSFLLFPIEGKSSSERLNNSRRKIEIMATSIPSTRTPFKLISLYQDETKLEAYFYDALGPTQITVFNHSGICVYYTIIDVNSEESTVIDLSLCPEGNYIINFTTDKNTFCGHFQLQ